MNDDEFERLDAELERRLHLAEEIADAVMDALTGATMVAFAEGRVNLLVDRTGISILEVSAVPTSGAN